MKSRKFPITKLSWNDPLEELFARKSLSSSAKALQEAGIVRIEDLLKIIPLRIVSFPEIAPFNESKTDTLFYGVGTKVSFRENSGGNKRGKGNISLTNLEIIVRDKQSNSTISLKWFNVYPSLNLKLKSTSTFYFRGTVSFFGMSKQIIAPEWSELPFPPDHSKKVIYPTIAGVPPLQVKKVIDKIPEYLWKKIADPLRGISSFPLDKAYRIIHGIEDGDFEAAKRRLAYQHFFDEQIKIILRRNHNRLPAAPVIKSTADQIESLTSRFPYALTIGQRNSIAEILKDLNSSSPMMRLLQGDVGCGKSTVAFIVSKICIDQHFQVAYMGPTEALVLQQFNEAKTLFPELSICLLTGGLKNSEKKIILDGLSDGSISYIFGTHALFQKEVQFKNLGMIIIDEQHKFGVRQRLSLGQKAKEGVHCLTMTATPIPRSLCLTQYGDLDISTIQTIPEGRRGQKTRIVTEETFESFLRFLKTRLTLGEQAYIVAPAIQESVIDIHNVESISERFKKFFPEETIATIHGKLNAEEKTNIFLSFQRGEIQILIATSVIEVGINVPNATVMAILNPERFGLSSLHQLRGRVGRGSRPGFCFLICEGNTSNESLARLKIIEQHNDGFKIAEEDLKIRGRGDLFGIQQSGSQEFKLLTDFVEQDKLIEQARKDAQAFIETHGLELFNHLIEETVTHTF